MEFNVNNIILNKRFYCANHISVDTAKLFTQTSWAQDGNNYFDIRNDHPANPVIRFRCSLTGETVCMEIIPSYVNLKKNLMIENIVRLKTNTIDINGDNDLVLKGNDIESIKFDKFTEDAVEKEEIICSKQLRVNAGILIRNLQINQFPVGVEYCDFRLEDVDSVMRFYLGNSTSSNFQIIYTGIILGRVATCNGGFKKNNIDIATDTDLIISRNTSEALRVRASDNLIFTSDTSDFSSPKIYSNELLNRTLLYGTIFMEQIQHQTEKLNI